MKKKKDIIYVENVNKFYGSKKTGKETYALDLINFSVREGEFLCILGPSGCGKSTLLNILAGFDTPTTGKVTINWEEVKKPNPKYVTMFQDNGLFPWRNVFENVTFGLELKGIPKSKQTAIAQKYIDLVHLKGFESKYPAQLSGGMRRRVALARTFAVDPEVIFMDEPFTGLDAFTKLRLEKEINEILEKEKKTLVCITHDINTAIALGDRLIVLSERPGKIKKIIDIPMKRPRDRNHKDFLRIREEIISEFE